MIATTDINYECFEIYARARAYACMRVYTKNNQH